MANTTIVLKKSGVSGNVPSVLANGELSINYADGKLFYRAANGTITSISSSAGGGGSTNSFATINANSSLILATSNNDTLSIVPGNNISFTTNTTTKSITIHSNTSSGGGGGTVALNGFSPNTVITANSTGYLSNTTNLNFFTSNNNLVVTGNVIGGGVRSTSSATPPTSPTVGDIWYYTDTDTIYRYTSDGTTSVWLDITGTNISGNNVNYGISIGKAVAMAMIFGG